jgi:hypothetical protein
MGRGRKERGERPREGRAAGLTEKRKDRGLERERKRRTAAQVQCTPGCPASL